jgi:hypothetical protein
MNHRVLPFAENCRARLGLNEAPNSAPAAFGMMAGRIRRRWHALTEHRSHAAWHAACWLHRRHRGNA